MATGSIIELFEGSFLSSKNAFTNDVDNDIDKLNGQDLEQAVAHHLAKASTIDKYSYQYLITECQNRMKGVNLTAMVDAQFIEIGSFEDELQKFENNALLQKSLKNSSLNTSIK